MATKLEVYYTRDLVLNPLDVTDLKNIIKLSPLLRLCWGKEYVDFHFTTPVDKDPDIEKLLQEFHDDEIYKGEDFPREDFPRENLLLGLYPVDGSYSLLGRGVSQNSIDLKIYNLKEFCEISKKAQELVAMGCNEVSIPGSAGKDLFHKVKVRSYIDYPWIITDLEKNGFLNTFPSENILRTDERRFNIKSKSAIINPDLSSYIGQTFEVDSLGTSFYSELSEGIVFLSSMYFKDTPRKI